MANNIKLKPNLKLELYLWKIKMIMSDNKNIFILYNAMKLTHCWKHKNAN